MAAIRPRVFPIASFNEGIPRRWLAGSMLASHLANGVNLLFPAGERFFVRSVRKYLDQIAGDAALVEAVRGFAGQEGHHARAHEAFFEVMEGQGYEIRGFLRAYERLAYGVIEPMFPPSVRLAVTAASEHFTAIMAENLLTMVDEREMHPVMRRLLTWHACEEIEHRSVAFDVFQRVDGRYSVRMLGLAIGTLTLAGFWVAGTLYLLSQEKDVWATLKREAGPMREHQPFGERVFGRGLRAYIERDFHPNKQRHLDELAARVLGALEPELAAAPAA